jgi:hypothetical protein
VSPDEVDLVMAGLVPAIQDLWCGKDVDARSSPGTTAEKV